jgi:hypothetical protein
MVCRATRPRSSPLYDPALGKISKNEPRRRFLVLMQHIVHPKPLTVLARSLLYNPSVTPIKDPSRSAAPIQTTSNSLPCTSSHIHSPPSDRKWSQKDTNCVGSVARGGPMLLLIMVPPAEGSTCAGTQCPGIISMSSLW